MSQYTITLHFRNQDTAFIETDEEHNFGKNAEVFANVLSDFMVNTMKPVWRIRDLDNELHWFRVDDLVRFSVLEYANSFEAVLE